jgi:hypothetical protein
MSLIFRRRARNVRRIQKAMTTTKTKMKKTAKKYRITKMDATPRPISCCINGGSSKTVQVLKTFGLVES